MTKTNSADSIKPLDTKTPLSKIKHEEVVLKQDGAHSILHKVDLESDTPKMAKPKSNTKPSNPMFIIGGSLAIVVAGVVTGFGLSKVTSASSILPGSTSTGTENTGVEEGTGKVTDGSIKAGDLLGNSEKKGDEAEGVLEKGGINGEGSHRLLRDGGPSRNVYLTSSVVDLDQLVGHKVKVWGETFAAQSAGWLMDVVTVEVVALDAEKPFEE